MEIMSKGEVLKDERRKNKLQITTPGRLLIANCKLIKDKKVLKVKSLKVEKVATNHTN
jgi:hypothetical protein